MSSGYSYTVVAKSGQVVQKGTASLIFQLFIRIHLELKSRIIGYILNSEFQLLKYVIFSLICLQLKSNIAISLCTPYSNHLDAKYTDNQ